VVGDEKYAVAGEGKDVGAPACSCSRSARLLVPKTLPYPANPGLALRRRKESVEVGLESLSQLGVRMELQELKSFLTKIKDDVELGIKRVEEAMGSLGLDGLKVGLGDGQSLVYEKDAALINLKPKRKNRRNKKKRNKKNPFGPKPVITLVGDEAGAKPTRPTLETQSFQAGESSEAGAGCVAGVLGSRPSVPSILGKFGWARKVG
jgi:hypothetical protein